MPNRRERIAEQLADAILLAADRLAQIAELETLLARLRQRVGRMAHELVLDNQACRCGGECDRCVQRREAARDV